MQNVPPQTFEIKQNSGSGPFIRTTCIRVWIDYLSRFCSSQKLAIVSSFFFCADNAAQVFPTLWPLTGGLE